MVVYRNDIPTAKRNVCHVMLSCKCAIGTTVIDISSDTLSYAAWSLFHAAFPAQPDLTHNFSIMHSDTTHSWNSIILSLGQLTNAATLFSISGLTLSLQHLLSLITIPSLAMLVHLHPNQVATQPLSISDLRIWLRAVREKQACRELKVLVLGALGDDEGAPVKLDHLSSFPALAVVGITRSVLRRPTNSRRHATEEKQDEIGTHWERAEKKRSEEYTAILYGEGSYAQCPMAERTQRLFTSINLLSETEKNDRSPVRLSLTCHGDAIPRSSGLPDVAWFIRRRCEPEKTNKRAPDTVMPQDKNDTRAKQRKIRQGKQQDVGALLGMFG